MHIPHRENTIGHLTDGFFAIMFILSWPFWVYEATMMQHKTHKTTINWMNKHSEKNKPIIYCGVRGISTSCQAKVFCFQIFKLLNQPLNFNYFIHSQLIEFPENNCDRIPYPKAGKTPLNVWSDYTRCCYFCM